MALPRDPNPYQELLYRALRLTGVRVDYGAELTPSHTLNLLLLPLELLARRLLGYRVLHLHWVFGFGLPGSGRYGLVRRVARLWFVFNLTWARLVGFKLVWTAHNVLPHNQVFDDDAAARRSLVRGCELVIAHTAYALDGLAALGARPRRSRVMPLGPMVSPEEFDDLPEPGSHPVRTALFFGRVVPYKGVDDLLVAIGQDPGDLELIVVGSCSSPEYRRLLEAKALQAGQRVRVSLGHVPDSMLHSLFAQADALVFPFRAVTTSSSVLHGMLTGRPVVIPDLPALADLPDAAVIRYPPGLDGLRGALAQLNALPAAELAAKGACGRVHAGEPSWDEIAAMTVDCFRAIEMPNK